LIMTSGLGVLGLGRLTALAGTSFVGGVLASKVANRRQHKDEEASHADLFRLGIPRTLSPSQPLCYANHCLHFDAARKVPAWVAEHLHRDKAFPAQPAANRKQSKFRPDPALHTSARATNEDFWDSGFSRGHMAPAGNNKHCQQSMDDTFLLSNVVPQVSERVFARTPGEMYFHHHFRHQNSECVERQYHSLALTFCHHSSSSRCFCGRMTS